MVWLIAGQDRAAVDAVEAALCRVGAARMDKFDRRALAEDVVAGLGADGWYVRPEEPKPYLVHTGCELLGVLTDALEQCLDWEAFKSSTDGDIARSLYEWVLSAADVKLVAVARDGNDEVL